MKSKTRKLIWSVPLVATLAIVGALAAFVALGLPNATPAEAQEGGFTTNPGMPTGVTASGGNGTLTVSWTMPTDGTIPLGTPTYNAFSVQYHMVATGVNSAAADSSGWMESGWHNGTGAWRSLSPDYRPYQWLELSRARCARP